MKNSLDLNLSFSIFLSKKEHIYSEGFIFIAFIDQKFHKQ